MQDHAVHKYYTGLIFCLISPASKLFHLLSIFAYIMFLSTIISFSFGQFVFTVVEKLDKHYALCYKLNLEILVHHLPKQRTYYPLHPNISMHVLHTVLFTFPEVPTRRLFSGWSFSLFSRPQWVIQGCNRKEKLDVSHSKGSNGLIAKELEDEFRRLCH